MSNPFSVFWKYRLTIVKLIFIDLRKDRFNSFLGFAWVILNPLLTTLLVWGVVHFGFKANASNVQNFPIWFLSAYLPWIFLSSAIQQGTLVFLEQSFLLKKIVFPAEILPLVKILSQGLIHLAFLTAFFAFLLFSGIAFSFAQFYVLVYFLIAVLLCYSICLLTSFVTIYFRDISYLVGIFFQFGFWVTPIFWDLEIFSKEIQFFLKLNPFCGIVLGYRNALLHPDSLVLLDSDFAYILFFTLFSLVLNWFLFQKAKRGLAEVL